MSVPASEEGKVFEKASRLVDRAISEQGQSPAHGDMRTFDDIMREGLYSDYIEEATRVVDEGRWQDADSEARRIVLNKAIGMLSNQEV